MSAQWSETEPDVIQRILDLHNVRDSGRIAQMVHSALIQRRLLMLSEDLERRRRQGLV